jgi:hypothetical protein
VLFYAGVCCRLLLGAVFILSAASKLRSRVAFDEFEAATQSLLNVPPRPGRALAIASIGVELLAVFLLVIPTLIMIGFAVSCALLLTYSTAIGRALRRGVRTPCRCIGASSEPLGGSLLLRNGILVAGCAVGLWAGAAVGTAVDLTTALGASVAIAAFATVLVASFDDLVYLARRSPV